MADRIRCRLGRHRWVQERRTGIVCRDCGVASRRRKTVLCRLGLHNWIPVSKAGARYLECRRCGHYGGDPGSFNWVPNRNREP
jgi:hypothetical protein